MVDFKNCTKCNRSLKVEFFHKDKYAKSGYYPSCKECVNLKPSKTDKASKAAYDREYRKTLGFKKAANQYKVTEKLLIELLSSQNNTCAICKKSETSKHSNGTKMRLAIDHCHTTGKIRGFLCSLCNKALGLFKDDTVSLLAAIEYLNRKI